MTLELPNLLLYARTVCKSEYGDLGSSKFESDYSTYKEKCGGCYYFLKEGDKIVAIRNEKYSFVPPLRNAVASEIRGYSGPMYTTFISNPEKFRFLSEP